MASTATATSSTRIPARRLVVLVVLLASQFLISADFSIINVALPRVGGELGFAATDLQWIATTFAVCAAGCTLVFGRIGDFLGRRRIFLVGMVVLAVSSLLGGLATTPAQLLVARTLQGLATASILPASLALLTTSFSEPRLRARALGLNSVMMSSGFIAGSIIGGVLADVLSWRWAFIINVPVAVVALVLVPLLVEESRAPKRGRLDLPGAFSVTAGMFALVFGVSRATESGLDLLTIAALLSAVGLLALFWTLEKRNPDALVPVEILRRPDIAWSNGIGMLVFAGETALIFLTGLYVQGVLGLSPLATGLSLLGIGVGQTLVGVFGPRLLDIVPARTMLGVAVVGQGAFMLPMLWSTADPAWLVPMVATQFANGAFSMLAALSFMVLATSAIDLDQQGLATGMATQSQQVGMAIGIPLLSAVLALGLNGSGLGPAQLDSIQLAIAVDAVVLIAAGTAALVALRHARTT